MDEGVKESRDYSFPAEERRILELWDSLDAFKEQLRRTEGQPEFVFYDGPPFATGLPHYGHILAGTLKDTVTRYASMTGYHVTRRFGWDCHGLPVEYEIDKKLGIKSKADVEKMGIAAYNEECRSIVMRYSKEWEIVVRRLGRWIDFEKDYKTMNPGFMESVWWVFKQLWDKGMVYRGVKVMPYSTGCGTPLSNFEAGLNYKECQDPAIMVAFPIKDDPNGASMVAWTTTPWTLPSNLALCVNPELDYVTARYEATGAVYVVSEARFPIKVQNKVSKDPAKDWKIMSKCKGKDLVGKRYEPLFPFFKDEFEATAFKILADNYVTATDGTGVVHIAPGFGEDDYRVSVAAGVVTKGGHVPCPVDDAGRFIAPVSEFAGHHVKEAEKAVTAAIKAAGRLVNADVLTHSYPFCWRSDTPLIYRVIPSWFVRVEEMRDNLLKNCMATEWVPAHIREGRFYNWLQNARDWAISRTRYWGTPLPVWANADFSEVIVIGSATELSELTGRPVPDLHRHFIDDLEIPSRKGGAPLRRVPDVFDCWFESGSMPYAHIHYPFENKEFFEGNFPAHFIAEGLDQTRGWFYTLMVLSTALFDRPPFRNVICSGLVLAADGKKMSKRLKNYPDPTEVIEKHGSDALRLYLINSPVVRAETLKFKEDGVFSIVRDVLLPWYNAYFMLSQCAARLVREEGVDSAAFLAQHGEASAATSNALDRWLHTQLGSLVSTVREEMGKYRVYNVVPALTGFIEHLTNVYVRLNRKRLKGKEGKESAVAAVSALYTAMLQLAQLMAPFTPFLAESMFQTLRRAAPDMLPPSVHFCSLPEAGPSATDADLAHMRTVDKMWAVIEQVRALRERNRVPVKTPLLSLTIVSNDAHLREDVLGELGSYVKDEMNVWELRSSADLAAYTLKKAEPNMAVLGRKLGRDVAKVKQALAALTYEQVGEFERAGSLTVEGHSLTLSDVVITSEYQLPKGLDKGQHDVQGCTVEGGDLVVLADMQQTEELLQHAFLREVGTRLQSLRKKAGMQPGDPARFLLWGASPAVAAELVPLLATAGCGVEKQVDGTVSYVADMAAVEPRPAALTAAETMQLSGWGSNACGAEVALTAGIFRAYPTVRAARVVAGGPLGNGAAVAAAARALATRELAEVMRQARAAGGKITVAVDGAQLEAELAG